MNNSIQKQTQNLKLYAVRNKEGKWFRAKGWPHGRGETWIENLNQARIYTKITPARSIITYFHNQWPEYGIPDLIEFSIGQIKILDEQSRVNKAHKNKLKSDACADKRKQEWIIQQAKEQLEKAQETIKKYTEETNES